MCKQTENTQENEVKTIDPDKIIKAGLIVGGVAVAGFAGYLVGHYVGWERAGKLVDKAVKNLNDPEVEAKLLVELPKVANEMFHL